MGRWLTYIARFSILLTPVALLFVADYNVTVQHLLTRLHALYKVIPDAAVSNIPVADSMQSALIVYVPLYMLEILVTYALFGWFVIHVTAIKAEDPSE